MAGHFTVTYDVVTPESAEYGDAAERGFASPGGWKQEDRPEPVTLREALRAAGSRGGGPSRRGYGFEDCGRWFATVDADQDYRTGEETTYAIHPPKGITPSSYRRVSRLLTGRAGR